VRVDEKTNEIPVAQAVLPTLPIRHRVCTADAFHTQTDFMRVIHAQQAETVLRCQRQSAYPLRRSDHLFC